MESTAINPLPRPDAAQILRIASSVILPRGESETAPRLEKIPVGRLQVGVDLGTAYLVLVVLDEDGIPLTGEWQYAQVVRDGLVVDFVGAVDLLRGMKERVEYRLGRTIDQASTAYPPGVPLQEVRATSNVLEAAGIPCSSIIDEPTAANFLLGLREGAVVDVGGGTTGIAVLKNGRVIYTADEPTGGTHFSLVIAGALDIPFEDAERLKTTVAEHQRLFPIVKPVMEKVANITARHVRDHNVNEIILVGGTSAFSGIDQVVTEYSGISASVPDHPGLVTPLGIALHNGLTQMA